MVRNNEDDFEADAQPQSMGYAGPRLDADDEIDHGGLHAHPDTAVLTLAEWMAADFTQLKFTHPKEYNRQPAPPARVERRREREEEEAAARNTRRVDEPPSPERIAPASRLSRKRPAPPAPSSSPPQPSPTVPTPAVSNQQKVDWEPEVPDDIELLEVYRRRVNVAETQQSAKKPKTNADGSSDFDWIGAKGKRGRGFFWNVKWTGYPVDQNSWEPTKNVDAKSRQGLRALKDGEFEDDEDENNDDEDDEDDE